VKSGFAAGIEGEATLTVREPVTITLGSGAREITVFMTPALVWLIEEAARQALVPYYDDGEDSVGMTVNVQHLAPTPVGMRVTAKARLDAIDRRRCSFAVEVFDEVEKIGEATHDRFVIDVAKFAAGVREKSKDRA
jgi:predicted thioesterase